MSGSVRPGSVSPPPGSVGLKLAEQTAAKIENAIIEQRWPLGTVLGSESDLLSEYGVSRAVLREAVRLLEHDHVARMRRGPGGGLVVAEPDADAVLRSATRYLRHRGVQQRQLFTARTAIELAAVRTAAEAVDEPGVQALRDVLDREPAAEAGLDTTRHDFHLLLARLSGNPAIELCAEVLINLTAGTLARDAAPGGRPARTAGVPDAHEAHQGIAAAIIAGDLGLAQHRMTRHLEALAEASTQRATTAVDRPARRRRR
jgi:DNA-binding FadR family transcriptional regulator